MFRFFLILFFCFYSLIDIKGQLPDGSVAPDWTLTDLIGASHNLYSYLDNGYTVFFDFSAASLAAVSCIWC